jgi:hypothetical protein
MNYREQLEKAKEIGIDPISLQVANEVECVIVEFEMTPREYQLICSFVEQCYLKSEYSNIYNLVRAIRDLILKQVYNEEKEENIYSSIEELINETSRWDLLEVASWYD